MFTFEKSIRACTSQVIEKRYKKEKKSLTAGQKHRNVLKNI